MADRGDRAVLRYTAIGLVTAAMIAGCAKIEVKPKPGDGGNHQQSASGQPQQPQQSQQPVDMSLNGDWQVGFQFNNTTINSTMHLQQQGNTFHGTGTDSQNGMAFKIEQGQINNDQVQFFKKYDGSSSVQYTGKLEILNDPDYHGPYMSGDYTTASKGNIISNIWQAQKILPNQPQAPAQAQAQAPAPAPQVSGQAPNQAPPSQQSAPAEPDFQQRPPDKAPDLSGKWEVGYESDFKTINSTMYIEQDGGRVTGHGVDINTKEKFTIDKGWYDYPKLTIVRKYEKAKGAKENRTLTFKAKVSIIMEKDYQGPYLNGKTSGGGAWEAQLIK